MTKRAILFWFHGHFELCVERVALLRALNPGLPIFGMFGSTAEAMARIPDSLKSALDHVFPLEESPDWCWRLGATLGVRKWYREVGHLEAFDVLHLVEWDLILLEPIDALYRNVPPATLGLTSPLPMARVKGLWYWTLVPSEMEGINRLVEFLEREFNQKLELYASIGPGTCYPRAFLHALADTDVPPLTHDEIRLPLMAQVLQTPFCDNGFLSHLPPIGPFERAPWLFRKIRSRAGRSLLKRLMGNALGDKFYFNCGGIEIDAGVIERESKIKTGRRVFHPCVSPLPFLSNLGRTPT